MTDARCTSEILEVFAGLGIAVCIAVAAVFAYLTWAFFVTPLIADWRGRKHR